MARYWLVEDEIHRPILFLEDSMPPDGNVEVPDDLFTRYEEAERALEQFFAVQKELAALPTVTQSE